MKDSTKIRASFKKKMLGYFLPLIMVTFAIMVFIIYKLDDQYMRDTTIDYTKQIAYRYANEIEAKFMQYVAVGRTYNLLLSGYKSIEDPDNRREYFYNLTRTLLEHNKNTVGLWLDFNKNAFDEQDAMYAGSSKYGKTGRYNVGWNRSLGYIQHDEATEDFNADYYVLPKQAEREITIGPYLFSYTGKPEDSVWSIAINAPIFSSNKEIVGVSGIDVSLEFIKKIINELKPFGTGYAMLFSSDGYVITHPDTTIVGTLLSDNSARFKTFTQNMKTNKLFYYHDYSQTNDEQSLMMFVPVQIGNENSKMFLGVSIPHSTMFANNQKVLKILILTSIAMLIIIAIIIFVISSKLSKPLMILSDEVNKLAKGNLNMDLNHTSNDEIGLLYDTMAYVADTLKSLMYDVNAMMSAVSKGDLDMRVDTNKYSGAYKDLIGDINILFDKITIPLNITAEYLGRISKGDIPLNITAEYLGGFAGIRDNLNACIDAISLFIKDTYTLVDHAIVGRMLSRADLDNHSGDFRKIVAGINELLDVMMDSNANSEYFNKIAERNVDAGMLETEKTLTEIQKANRNITAKSDFFNAEIAKFSNLLISHDSELQGKFGEITGSIYSMHINIASLLTGIIQILKILENNELSAHILEEFRKELTNSHKIINTTQHKIDGND